MFLFIRFIKDSLTDIFDPVTFHGGIKSIQSTRLKNKIENNSTWEGAFYQSEWLKTNSRWVVLVFSLYVCCC